MSNHMIDTIGTPMRGEFFVRGINRAGEIVFTFEDNNMIVTAAKETLANLIGGDSAGKSITNIAFGNSNATPAPDNDSVGGVETDSLTMGANMSGTTMVAYMKSITSHSYPQAGRVQFSWALDFGEANGLAIQDYGLICSDLTLFARKTRGVITKGGDLYMDGTWTIIF
jgi:hypothetical protein